MVKKGIGDTRKRLNCKPHGANRLHQFGVLRELSLHTDATVRRAAGSARAFVEQAAGDQLLLAFDIHRALIVFGLRLRHSALPPLKVHILEFGEERVRVFGSIAIMVPLSMISCDELVRRRQCLFLAAEVTQTHPIQLQHLWPECNREKGCVVVVHSLFTI